MSKKEIKIGDEFDYCGVKLRCEKRPEYAKGCQGCYFYTNGLDCSGDDAIICIASDRIDNTEVRFVKVPNNGTE